MRSLNSERIWEICNSAELQRIFLALSLTQIRSSTGAYTFLDQFLCFTSTLDNQDKQTLETCWAGDVAQWRHAFLARARPAWQAKGLEFDA